VGSNTLLTAIASKTAVYGWNDGVTTNAAPYRAATDITYTAYFGAAATITVGDNTMWAAPHWHGQFLVGSTNWIRHGVERWTSSVEHGVTNTRGRSSCR